MNLSVIIPTYNEELFIGNIIDFFIEADCCYEIIVVDARSEDNTTEICHEKRVKCISSTERSRAIQMNLGAKASSGDVLYFVHADVIPVKSFYTDIVESLEEGYKIGSYRFQFNSNSTSLKVNAFFTRFNLLICRGGDQTLFVTRNLFQKLEGFNEEVVLMEDFEFIRRAKKIEKFKVIQKDVIVSDRKYQMNPYYKVSFANALVFSMFYLGFSSERMKQTYHKLLNTKK